MRKKNWLIGSVAAAAVVICGAVGINSVKAADSDAAKSAKEEFVYEQVGDSYDMLYNYSYASDTWLTSDEDKKISIISGDGSVYDLDNTDGKYGNIQVISSINNENFRGYIYTADDSNKVTLIDYDGNYAFDNGGYHDSIYVFEFNGSKYMIITDDGKSVVKAEDGTDVTDKLNPDGKELNSRVNNYLDSYIRVYYKDGSTSYFDKNMNNIDMESKLAQDGYSFLYMNEYGDKYIAATYCKYINEDKGYFIYCIKYFDADLKPYNDSTPKQYGSIEAEKPSVKIDSTSSSSIANNFNGRVFTYNLSKSSETYKLEDDYSAAYTGTLLGYKVIQGTKTVDGSTSYAMFDENGVKLYDGVTTASRADKLVVKSGKSYTIVKVSLKAESGETDIVVDEDKNSVADVVAKDVDIRDIKDENGNKITVDDLDEVAKAVIEQKFNFAVKAKENVIPEGSKISVAKVVSGKEYVAAKKVTADKVDKIAVFNIDLINKDNVQIHEVNGKIEITTEIPTGFDANKVAVYRLSEDGTTYTKLVSKVENGKVTFETDHFSTYMIVEEKVASSESVDDKVQTGDMPVTAIIALIALMAIAGAALIASTKKTRA